MKTNIKRSELYAKVWQAPMTRLAKEFDISDVGLAKTCRKNNIPTPRAGYWAKVAHGKAPPPTPLPQGEDVVIRLEAHVHRMQPASFKRVAAVSAELVAPVVQIASTDDSDRLATYSRATHAALKKVKANSSGFLRCETAKAFTCIISQGTWDRAIPLLDAIERTLTNVGGDWKPDVKSGKLMLEMEGEQMQLTLTERYKRTEHLEPKPDSPWYTPLTYTYQFPGELTLTLEADYRGRRTWSDGKKSLLEGKLDEVAIGVQNAARAIRELRDERDAEQKRWAEEARLRQEAETKARHFNQFRSRLLAEANAWQNFQLVTDYVAHIEALLAAEPKNHNAEAMQAWMQTAQECTSSLDPSTQRVKRLQLAVDGGSYYGPFGQPIV
ncbi:hypothetical protein [Aquabacterium sp.]|uniref:hypothetical protein n=1 Tax=Aquabacterium sp. TaxID=1872578 RepID=UPI00248955CB|nr:hypothetical protein [Aquabacterium sp.]MDI1258269.1 hypothetical protein [Aquabacterium sp.]